MKFKEFVNWCNDRACDGCWGIMTAIYCLSIVDDIRKLPFWKREKAWEEKYMAEVVKDIVEPINSKIKEMSVNNGRYYINAGGEGNY